MFTIFFITIGCRELKSDIHFNATGGDLVDSSFVSKDGWVIRFSQVLINIDHLTAYNAYYKDYYAELDSNWLIDLVPISKVNFVTAYDVLRTNYQGLTFNLKQIESGRYRGSSMVLKGCAIKGREEVYFVIKITDEIKFNGINSSIGSASNGYLNEDDIDIEINFRLEHIFGDKRLSNSNSINILAPGFDIFNTYNNNGFINISQKDIDIDTDYQMLTKAIKSMAYLGDSHCTIIY